MSTLLTRRTAPLLPNLTGRWEPLPTLNNLLTWDPFQDFLRMDPFRTARNLMSEAGQDLTPALEVKETPTSFVFKMDVPGIKEADLDVSLSGTRLTISGKRDAEMKEEKDTYLAYERRFGSFHRSFTLPDEVDADKVKADLKDGVLQITALKLPEARSKHIEVKTT